MLKILLIEMCAYFSPTLFYPVPFNPHPNEVEAREMKRNTLIELTDVSESMACELDAHRHL